MGASIGPQLVGVITDAIIASPRAAELAAYHSEARQGQNVAVDVTQVKNVKKPAGSKPGMVVYYTYRTVYVNPAP